MKYVTTMILMPSAANDFAATFDPRPLHASSSAPVSGYYVLAQLNKVWLREGPRAGDYEEKAVPPKSDLIAGDRMQVDWRQPVFPGPHIVVFDVGDLVADGDRYYQWTTMRVHHEGSPLEPEGRPLTEVRIRHIYKKEI